MSLLFRTKIFRFIGHFVFVVRRLYRYFLRQYERSLFAKCGGDTYIGHHCLFTFSTISIGCHTYIGSNCVIQSAHGKIIIGNHVMFGPGVHVHGGNHITKEIGVYMDEAKKLPNSDGVVRIEDDVWCGANAIILGGGKDLTIGKGSVIGAGSIVTKNIPPYSIAMGVPAKVIKTRFSTEEISLHEKILYNRNR